MGRPEARTEEEEEGEDGEGQEKGEEVAKVREALSPVPTSLWAIPTSEFCVRLVGNICVANKIFSEDYPKQFSFPGNWIQASPSLGPFLCRGKKRPALCWMMHSTPRWQCKGL